MYRVFLGEGNGNPLQYSCLENLMDRGVWQAAVHRVEQSQTPLKRLSSSNSRRSLENFERIAYVCMVTKSL